SIINGIGAGIGGGIRNIGTLSLTDVMLTNNQILGFNDADDGNATVPGSHGADLLGGAIYSRGSLAQDNSTLSGDYRRGQNGAAAPDRARAAAGRAAPSTPTDPSI